MTEDASSRTPERNPPRTAKYRTGVADDVLVAACLRGDGAAWDALIERYQGFIYSVALRRGLSPSDAEDVFQNVCVKLYEHLADLRDVQRLTGWLASVASREAAQLFRKETPRLFSETETLSEDSDAGESIHASPSISPEEEVLALEQSHHVRLTMQELSDECRQLLTMLYATEDPRSYNEVSDELKIPLGSIGPKRARCLAKLRALLERIGY